MRKLITKKYSHLLYRDECRDTFLITKYMEIYRKSKTSLGCTCWSYKTYSKLKAKGIIFNEWTTDDRLYTFETDNANLDLLISMGYHSRRVHKRGRWLKGREKKLAHRIYPFNPKLKEDILAS